MELHERAINAAARQLSQVNAIILAEKSPAAARQALEARQTQLTSIIAGGGPRAQWAIMELIKVDQQDLQLGKQLDDLKLMADALADLERLKTVLQEQLCVMTGETDPLLAELTITNE